VIFIIIAYYDGRSKRGAKYLAKRFEESGKIRVGEKTKARKNVWPGIGSVDPVEQRRDGWDAPGLAWVTSAGWKGTLG
jgi:hypothetical protein